MHGQTQIKFSDLVLQSHFFSSEILVQTFLSFSWFHHVALSILIETSVSVVAVYCLESYLHAT
jgi:hypothetical protein